MRRLLYVLAVLVVLPLSAKTLRLPAHAPGAHVVVRGADHCDDTLVIELPVAAKQIDYDGGAGGFDVLELHGGSARVQRITQLNKHDGVIEIDGLTIRYFNLEPITDTVPAATLVINGTPGADTVTVSDGPGGTTMVSSPTFESVTFANKTSVTFDGLGGGDSITFNNSNPATGLTSFVVQNVATVGQTAAIRYPALGASATGNINLSHSNDVDNVELATTGGTIVFNDTDDAIIGGVSPALAGIAGGSSVTVTTRGDVTVDAAATVTAAALHLSSTFGGVYVNGAVTTGAGGGDLLLLAQNPEGVSIDAAVQSQTGDVRLQSTRLLIGATGAIAAPLGIVDIETSNNGPNINLGSTTDAMGTGMEVSDAEIDRITTPVLSFETFIGAITVSQPISFTGQLVLRAPNAFNATGTGSLSAPTLTFESTAGGARTWTIAPAFVQQSGFGSAPVPYSGVTTLNVNTSVSGFFPSNSPDTFVVTPSATTTINIDAGQPWPSEAPPHDTLDFELAGVVSPVFTATLGPDGYSGSLTSANRQPINFAEIERFIDAPVDLQITKTDNATADVAGTTVTYDVIVTNNGGAFISGVAVTDIVPPQLINVTWICNAAGATCGGSGSGNINDVATFLPMGTAQYHITGTIDPGFTGTLTNTATVTTPPDWMETNPANNTATDTTEVVANADLVVTKSGPGGTPFAGDTLTYTITLRNDGPSSAQNVSLTDAIPAHTTFVSFTAAPGYTCATPPAGGTGNVTCTRAALAPSATADTFTLVVDTAGTTPGGTAIANTATATTTTPADNPSNSTATATTTLASQSDLIVTKSGPDGTTTFAGGELTYTITLRNAGPSDAQSVTLTDVIPASTTFVSFTAAPGYTCVTGSTVTCTRAVLPPSPTADTFTLVVRVNRPTAPGTAIANTVTATTTTPDPAANNSATSPAITVAEANIPTLSEWMLLLLAAMLVGVALKMMR
ncbi:MAG TPA: DUF11 domain-containing protein [Thermoanaerobaculia bacterium]|nr:DUF11 domain-containing protein [Thermoanaerobaculia bacterium]